VAENDQLPCALCLYHIRARSCMNAASKVLATGIAAASGVA